MAEARTAAAAVVPRRKRHWITVAVAGELLGLGKRGALKRLRKLDADLGGRLLRSIGTKAMPKGVQPSKFLVCLPVLREALDPEVEDQARELSELRVELRLLREKVEALRRAVRHLLPRRQPKSAA